MTVDVTGVNEVIRSLERYTKRLENGVRDLPTRLCEEGRTSAEIMYGTNLEYAGEVPVISVTVESTDEGATLVAKGNDLLFAEFGTGALSLDHPMQDLVLAHGEYGLGKGKHPPWVYKGEPGNKGTLIKTKKDGAPISRTYGTNPARGMYEADQDMKERRADILREVMYDG